MKFTTIRPDPLSHRIQDDFRSLSPAPRAAVIPAPRAADGGLKRLIDVVLAALILVALAPLFIGLALLIRRQMPGPIFYGHERIGLNGKRFRCWKFRTMRVNGDEILRQHFANYPTAQNEWQANRKLRSDPRVTPLGQVLREYSIDELPQFFNVLTGTMSLVGPRPVVWEELEQYGSSSRYYLSTRPGVTGLWQISGRSNTSYRRRVAFDRYYTTRRSVGLDLLILAKTLPAVVGSRGAY